MLLKYLIEKLFQENLPAIENKRCMNFNSKVQRCTRCEETCPTGAIRVNGKKILVDDQLCKGCGICRANCPSQAIVFKHMEELKAFKKLEENEIVTIGCNQEGNQGNINFSCLNGLHKEYLAALLIKHNGKKMHFSLGKCASCYVENNCEYFADSLKSAVGLVKHFNVSPKISLLYRQEDVPQWGEQTMSRRELFTYLKGQSASLASEVTNDVIGKKPLPTPRDFLIGAMDPWLASQSVDSVEIECILTNWQVNEQCNGCGICATMCPSKAWKVEEEEEATKISHNARSCTSCGLCYQVCPQGALYKGRFSTALLKGLSMKLEIRWASCKKCGAKYTSTQDHSGCCSVCEKRAKIRQSVL